MLSCHSSLINFPSSSLDSCVHQPYSPLPSSYYSLKFQYRKGRELRKFKSVCLDTVLFWPNKSDATEAIQITVISIISSSTYILIRILVLFEDWQKTLFMTVMIIQTTSSASGYKLIIPITCQTGTLIWLYLQILWAHHKGELSAAMHQI